jgi:hypothetical protein
LAGGVLEQHLGHVDWNDGVAHGSDGICGVCGVCAPCGRSLWRARILCRAFSPMGSNRHELTTRRG